MSGTAYDVTLAQINVNPFNHIGGAMGFPTSNFNTLLYSQWMCGPTDTGGHGVGIGPSFTEFFEFNISAGTIYVANLNSVVGSPATFGGNYPPPAYNVRHHVLLSINASASVVQLYIDDQPVTVTGSWGPQSALGLGGLGGTYWQWVCEGTSVSGARPGIGDIWMANRAGDTFVDISVVANRRKFINADLSPVYLGANGEFPFGTSPQIYCTIPAGSTNPADIFVNRGTGGANFASTGAAPSFQAPGTCSLPTPPPPPPAKLAMDSLLVTGATMVPTDTRIFLDWSDDRGHSFHIPVGQDIGKPGAYLTALQWQRLGYGRDRVFRLTWSAPVATALQGAWIQILGTGKT